jgi:hypothetical protein
LYNTKKLSLPTPRAILLPNCKVKSVAAVTIIIFTTNATSPPPFIRLFFRPSFHSSLLLSAIAIIDTIATIVSTAIVTNTAIVITTAVIVISSIHQQHRRLHPHPHISMVPTTTTAAVTTTAIVVIIGITTTIFTTTTVLSSPLP